MFLNIPLELVKKAISDRWNKIQSRTKPDKKKFLKGLDFIMNSTKVQLNGKFYKKKFFASIGSIISPLLAELVM